MKINKILYTSNNQIESEYHVIYLIKMWKTFINEKCKAL